MSEFHWRIGGKDIQARVDERDGRFSLSAGDREVSFSVLSRNESGGWFTMNGRNYEFFVYHQNKDETVVWIGGRTYRLDRIRKGGHSEEASTTQASGEIRSPMPGKILRVEVKAGDTVAKQQTLLIMESMKMETPLTAPFAGRVVSVSCQAGQTVDMGEILAAIEKV